MTSPFIEQRGSLTAATETFGTSGAVPAPACGDIGCGQRRRRRDLREPAIRGNYAEQQEAPAEVNRLMVDFLTTVDGKGAAK